MYILKGQGDNPLVLFFLVGGKKMLHLYNKTQSKITTIVAVFNAGSRIEKKAGYNEGISHMLEHCIFKGTNKRTSEQIIEDISMLGGYTNAFTSHEMVAYYIEVPYNNLEPALEILSDIVLNSKIPEEEFIKEETSGFRRRGFFL